MLQSIVHKCGHKRNYDLVGTKWKLASTQAAEMSEQDCRDCHRAYMNTLPPVFDAYLPTTDGVYIPKTDDKTIVVTNSYMVKDTLKARGYRYSPAVFASGRVTIAGWSLVFKTKSAVENELKWIETQGWKVNLHGYEYSSL